MTRRGQLNWLEIEKDWTEGNETVRAIGQKHGISHGRISQVAKAEGWGKRGGGNGALPQPVPNQPKQPKQSNQKTNQAKQSNQPKGERDIDIAVIREWKKGWNELARVRLNTFDGAPMVDIAGWYWHIEAGELRRGKGFMTKIAALPELAAAINAALEKAQELGLLKTGQGK
jgi:hypothetical protein